jgi:hypothetical protein
MLLSYRRLVFVFLRLKYGVPENPEVIHIHFFMLSATESQIFQLCYRKTMLGTK